jgi:DHA2 family multidrug resistance protein-like MFS transporter
MTARVDPAATCRRRWLILGVLCLSVLLVAMDNTIVNVALPTLNRKFSTSTSDLQWVVDIYTVFFAGLLLVFGNVGDRIGRKRVLQIGLVLFALASFASAYTNSVGALIMTRGAMGVAVALVYPSTLALLSTVFTDRQEKAVAVGVWSGVSGLAIALGPVLGGLLLEHFWWGSIFMINLPVIGVALVLGAVLLPESKDPSPGRFDLLGAVLSVTVIGLLIWTIIDAPTRGWTSPATLAGFGAEALMLALFIWWECRRDDPLLDIRFFSDPRFSAASAAISMAFFGLFGFIFMITMYFQFIRGFDTFKAGAATLPFAVIMGALSPLAILIVRRTGTKVVVTAGMLLMAAGFAVASTATVDSSYWGVVIVSMCLMAAGMALATSPATDAILASLPEAKVGVGSAINDTVRELGGALGVAVVGSVMSWFYSGNLTSAWTRLGIPADAVRTGQESLGSGLATGQQLLPAQVEPAIQAARVAFMHGLHAGSLTAAGAAVLAGLAALLFLPQSDSPAPPEQDHGYACSPYPNCAAGDLRVGQAVGALGGAAAVVPAARRRPRRHFATPDQP